MKILVWQWGRFGGAPRFASFLAEGLTELPGVEVLLSLSRGAEILHVPSPPHCDLPVDTYNSMSGYVARVLTAPFALPGLLRRLRGLRLDLCICALPGPLDLLMVAALRRLKVPFVVLVHDADAHPGDGFPLQMRLQRALCRRANAVAALTAHVGNGLLRQRLAGTPDRPLIRLHHPPMRYPFTPRSDNTSGTFRLLSFGRLLPYKGLDLLADSLRLLGPRPNLAIRVVGQGPECRTLAELRGLPGVTVENRWVPETEVGGLFDWADAVVLPYREASQSGVAAVALAAQLTIIATNVGGLAEQLHGEPLAILCDPNANSLASCLRRMLDEPRCAKPLPILNPACSWQELGRSLLAQTSPLFLRHRA